MNLPEIFLGCLTIIEFINLIIRIVKLSPTLDDKPPELTEEMRKRLYS